MCVYGKVQKDDFRSRLIVECGHRNGSGNLGSSNYLYLYMDVQILRKIEPIKQESEHQECCCPARFCLVFKVTKNSALFGTTI